MTKAIQLRGHHLLCLLGYRGMGYSKEFCENMTTVYEELRQKPETMIRIVLGPDDLCAAYPKDQEAHCENRTVYQRDAEIVTKLGLQVEMELSWSGICGQVARPCKTGRHWSPMCHMPLGALRCLCGRCTIDRGGWRFAARHYQKRGLA